MSVVAVSLKKKRTTTCGSDWKVFATQRLRRLRIRFAGRRAVSLLSALPGPEARLFFFKQKTAYEILAGLEFRRVLFRSRRRSGHGERLARGGGPQADPRRQRPGDENAAVAREHGRQERKAGVVARGENGADAADQAAAHHLLGQRRPRH